MKKILLKSCYILIIITMLAGALTGCNPEETPPPTPPADPTPLSISASELELAKGDSYTLTASGGDGSYSWESDSTSIVTVSGGVLTAVEYGTATISVTSGSEIKTCRVTVKECPIGRDLLRLNCAFINEAQKSADMILGDVGSISATLFVNGAKVNGALVSISTQNAEIVKISGGEVSAIGEGQSTVKAIATYGGSTYESKEYTFKVSNKAVLRAEKAEIALVAPYNVRGEAISVDNTKEIKVSVKNGDSWDTLSAQEVEWSVKDNNIATLENGVVTGVKSGNTEVVARYNGGETVIKVSVMIPIFTLEDMDYLGLSSYKLEKAEAEKVLSSNYILMNDLDYSTRARNWLVPIASASEEFFTALRADLSINGDISFYSRTWMQMLSLSKGTKNSATVLYTAAQEEINGMSEADKAKHEFKGINPNNLAFSGIFDGNGYSIKNAWLLNDNVQYTTGSSFSTGAQSFIGNLTGELRNISFENLFIGDNNMIIDFDESSDKYLTHVYNKNASQLYAPNDPLALYSTYKKDNADGTGEDLYMMSTNGIVKMRAGRDQWGNRNSATSALVLKNSGAIKNVYMTYSNTSSRGTALAGITLYNVGEISDCILVPVLDEYNDSACYDMIIGNPVAYMSVGKVDNVIVCHKQTTMQSYASIAENQGETLNLVTFKDALSLGGEPSYTNGFDSKIWDLSEIKLNKDAYGVNR